jgi:hypothetical protein
MSKHVIRMEGFINGTPMPHRGQYLKSFDFEAHDGAGEGEFVPKARDAKIFASAVDAFEFWRTVSRVKPKREDGEPNRPLTCANVAILEVPDYAQQKEED